MRRDGVKNFIWLAAAVILIITGCDGDEEWQAVQDSVTEAELTDFLGDYKAAWEEALEQHSFSKMETFFIANSHVFHMERRQHQQLTAERKIERFQEVENVQVEDNQYGEYRVSWRESVEVDQSGSGEIETRDRAYYISEQQGRLAITAIERN